VELIIALGLTSILIVGTFYAFGQGLRLWRETTLKFERLQVKNLVAERITRDIRGAKGWGEASSAEELILKTAAETISYKLKNKKVNRKRGEDSAYLTSAGEIKKLKFSYPAAGQVAVTLDDFSFRVGTRN
jgi:hypothetical protein